MSKLQETRERPLSERIAKARREGRTQQALELARALVKYEPTEAHRELLRQVTFERAQHLEATGMRRDAATVYGNLLTMGGTPEFLARVAEKLAACGAIDSALQTMQKLEDPAIRMKILQNAVDAALARGPSGKSALPADLHAAFDVVLMAFAHYEAGRDDDARAALQGIGLQSPFLDWKLVLRGLLAHAGDDDERALENWSRLDPVRLPCRLIAALRASIDPAYLASQPAAVQESLRSRITQQQGTAVAPLLREIKSILAGNHLAKAFRKAETLNATLRRDYPDLHAQLARCFAWAIIERGEPEDLDRYRRIFGSPADDIHLHRLEALALESHGMWPEAHQAWQDFIQDVADHPQAWPGETGKRAQALVWQHLAQNAMVKCLRSRTSGNPFFDLFASHTAPLKPGPEQCLENALKLNPDNLDAYSALFKLYRAGNKVTKAKKIGNQLLNRFPEHAETMSAMAELCMDLRDYKKAQEYLEKAMQANPLDRSLRGELARAKQNYALALTITSQFDLARAQLAQAEKLWTAPSTPVLSQWAILEIKAGDPVRASELIAQAEAQPNQRLACRFALVAECARARLPASQKKQIAADLKRALAQTPTPAELLIVLAWAAHQRDTHEHIFHGQKSQEKAILKFFAGISFDAFDELQLKLLLHGLLTLQARKPWLACLNHACRRFAREPFFRLSFVDYYLMDGTRNPKLYLARAQLDQARRLVQEMPRGEEQQKLLDGIKEREEVIARMEVRRPDMTEFLDRVFDAPFEDEFEDEYDDEF